MSKVFLVTALFVPVAIGLATTGCSKQQTGQQPPSTSPDMSQMQSTATGHEGHEQGQAGDTERSASGTHTEVDDALAQLSPEDRAIADKQKTCPVTDEPLGKMGKPYKVTIQGRDVLLCCPGCEAKIKEDPEKYLAKLPQ